MLIIKRKNEFQEEVGDEVLFYAGEFGYCFSNFSAFEVVWRDRTWKTSEHAYQSAKFDDSDIVEEIYQASSAHDALKLAIKYQDNARTTWGDEKLAVMKEICRAKLSQHPYIEKTLVRSGNATLIEDSPKDAYWGRGPDGKGRNELGKVWMELREELLTK